MLQSPTHSGCVVSAALMKSPQIGNAEAAPVNPNCDPSSNPTQTTQTKLHERELASADVNTDSQGNASYDFTVPSPGDIYVKAIVYENGKAIVNRGGSFFAPDK